MGQILADGIYSSVYSTQVSCTLTLRTRELLNRAISSRR